jgi:hypothetical protein
MIVGSKVKNDFRLIIVLLIAFIAYAPIAYGEAECSLAKTNHTCTLTIDRLNPLAPPTIQMYPGQVLHVKVTNPRYFERYFFDYQSGQLALSPDVASSIASSLLTPLQKAVVIHSAGKPTLSFSCAASDVAAIAPKDVASNANGYTQCFLAFAKGAKGVYSQLEPAVAPDSHSGEVPPLPGTNMAVQNQLQALVPSIDQLSKDEYALSASITAASKLINLTAAEQVEVEGLVALQTLADAVAKDFFSYGQRIDELPALNHGQMSCSDSTKLALKNDNGDIGCVWLFPVMDPQVANSKMVTRQVSYSLDTLNLISNSSDAIPDPTKKKTLATITVLYGDARWEVSAGTFFSSLANRSFAASPVFTNGVITDVQVTQSVLRPTVVPFAAANVRITNDFPRLRWRSALYWTGAVGVNPNTVSADFGSGPSVSWRGLMFSALWHYGHDVRLTQGLYVGESLGAGFKGSLPTQTYWTSSFALGVSVRVPALTGR